MTGALARAGALGTLSGEARSVVAGKAGALNGGVLAGVLVGDHGGLDQVTRDAEAGDNIDNLGIPSDAPLRGGDLGDAPTRTVDLDLVVGLADAVESDHFGGLPWPLGETFRFPLLLIIQVYSTGTGFTS